MSNEPLDKFSAVWVSYSSMKDFLACPKAYFLNNVYKDPKTGRKINIMSPALALGQAVHEVVESLSVLPTDKRFMTPLPVLFDAAFGKVSGKKGGFTSKSQEDDYKAQGIEMLKRVEEHPGPINNLAVKIKADLPHYWLSEEEGIILCGKIDWLEYLPDSDTVHIVDFKSGKHEEREGSLQLPIYLLLASNTQPRKVKKASYWYLRLENEPKEMPLPDYDEALVEVLSVAKQIKLARKLNRFVCPSGGCPACLPLEKVVSGEAEYVGTNDYNQDIYILVKSGMGIELQSEIL
jgi:hypothetical protein